MPPRIDGTIAAFCLLALTGLPVAAQTTLLEDGSFGQWTTVAGLTGHSVSGGVDGSAGAPAPSCRIEHVHTPAGTFGGSVVSRSTYTGATFDVSSFAAGDRLELRVDGCTGVLRGPSGPPSVALAIQLVVVQGETVLRSQQVAVRDGSPTCGTAAPVLGRMSLDATISGLRGPGGEPLNLSADAPRVRLGLLAQTTWGLEGTTLVRLDNLSVRHVAGAGPLVTFDLTDNDQLWTHQEGERIGYELEVENRGPARADLVLEMSVPNATCFSLEGSSVGWRCAQPSCSSDGVLRCTFALGPMAASQRRTISFSAMPFQGVPEEWEYLAEARLVTNGGQELANEEEVTPPISLAGPGCLCLFLPELCTAD